MNPSERRIYDLRIKLLETPLRPIIKLLTFMGIGADAISYTGVAVMFAFVLVVPHNPVAGFWLLFARMLLDVIDGPLARYQKTDSDRGKFVDVLMDNTGFALFILGVTRVGLMHGSSAVAYLFLTELVVVLMIIRYNFKHRSDWFFQASAGSFPYNFEALSYLIFAYYAFTETNYLNGAAQIFTVILAVKAITDYWAIQKTKKS